MDSNITILDGGMGRELERIGAPFRQPEWSALALTEGPERVVDAHRNFIDAGAEVITTNSYAIVPFHIGEQRFREEAFDLAALSGSLARSAAPGGGPVRVAGSLPPLFGSYRPDLFDGGDAPRIIDPLVAGLSGHVDFWLGETLGSIAEVRAVSDAVHRASTVARDLEVWISLTLDDHEFGNLRSGESVADGVAAALDCGAVAVLFNCAQSEAISVAIDIAVGTAQGRAQIGGYANRFVASHADDGQANEQISAFRDDLDPNSYSAVVASWLRAGASIVGGCCGMTPDHIAALRLLVDNGRWK